MADYNLTGLGYRRDLENMDVLQTGALPNDQISFGDIDPKSLAQPMGLINVVKCEQQGMINSCAGNSGSSILEACVWHQSGETRKVQLSRMFAYTNGQRHAGISGDNGCTLKGIIDGFKYEGCPEEQYAPYAAQRYTQFGPKAMQHAGDYKLLTYMPVTSVEQIYEGLAKRIGGLFLGMCWCGEFKSPRAGGLVNSFRSAYNNQYHAVCCLDWCDERDSQGYPRLRVFNSHGPGYGDRGTSLWSYDAMRGAIESDDTSVFFLSDMSLIKRRFDYNNAKWAAV